jgi:hypothetical protein
MDTSSEARNMGLSVQAFIVVGLPADKLKIEEMPLYKEGSEWSWRDLGEVYYAHDDMFGFGVIAIHKNSYDSELVFGIVVEQTGSWEALDVNLSKLQLKINGARSRFARKIGLSPGVYLMPGMR